MNGFMVVYFFRNRKNAHHSKDFLIYFLLIAVLGFFWLKAPGANLFSPPLPLNQQNILFEAPVAHLLSNDRNGIRFSYDTNKIQSKDCDSAML